MDWTLLLTALGVIAAIVIGGWQIYLARKQVKQANPESRQQQNSVSIADSAPVNLVSSEQETVKVVILLVTTGKRFHVELPLDVLTDRIVPALAEKLDIPQTFTSGATVRYHLYSKTRGKSLDNNLTLRENQVTEGDTLLFQADFV
ncbi:MAG: EsaB/YukD family protein, partial [Candidatus Marsarchaeota archaeon]|nr:EsaB/YukD family protein [Candidatus Marsarchaeota archaeon]